jgi:hypothetical protein
MSKFWQTKPKKDKQEDWKPRKPRKVVIDEKHLRASPSCPECRGRGYKVVNTIFPVDAGGKGVNVMAYCECVTRQLPKAEVETASIVLRSP